MAMKVYPSGDNVLVDQTSYSLLTIRQDRAKYIIIGNDVTVIDTFTNDSRTDATGNIQDSGGSPIGDREDIIKYFDGFIFRSDVRTEEEEDEGNDIGTLPPLDADGNLPVSQKTILGNYVMDVHSLPYLLDRKGTGTQVWSQGEVTMSVTAGQYAVCQSFQVHPYFAGKAQKSEITFDDFGHEVNVTKKKGYFTSDRVAPYNTNYDGFYIESDGTTYNLVIANGNLGTEVRVPQASWNNQTTSFDLTKFTVMAIDFLYLGGTAVRLWLMVDGAFVLMHTYLHAGIKDGTIVKSPSLPVRWEIRSTTGTGSMQQICADVTTSGTLELTGTQIVTPLSTNKVNANTANVTYMLKAIRLSPTIGLSKSLLSLAIDSLSTTNDDVWISLRINPTVAGAMGAWTELTDENGQNLGLQYADPDMGTNPSTTTVTGGMEFWGGFSGKLTRETQSGSVGLNRKIGIDLDGVPDTIVLCITPTPTGARADAYGGIIASIN